MMKKLILISAVLFIFSGLSVPLFADNHDASGENETTIDANALDALVLEWQAESDLLAKAALAKQIQELLKVKADGLIGKKTIAAIKAAGVTREIAKPTRDENAKIKLALQVSEGKLTQEQADAINAQRSAIKEIRDKVKAGELTEEEAKGKLDEIRKNAPEGNKPKKPKNEGGNKPKKSKNEGGNKPKKPKKN